MVNVIIDGKNLTVPENYTILDACKQAGIFVPTLCYLKEINEVGACRMCVVEVEGQTKLVASCNTKVYEGMEVKTNTERVQRARKVNLQLLLARHNSTCNTCTRNGNCTLQDLTSKYNVSEANFDKKFPTKTSETDFPLIRDNSKCIGCLRCVNVCEKVQALGVWELVGTGRLAKIDTKSGKKISLDDCSLCGQCITHCPVGALYERSDISKVEKAILDQDKITLVQIAPAVRSAFGEGLGLDENNKTVGKMVASAKALGFNYVFDTDFSADLTIMEESAELIDRIKNGGVMPMFTSCCPAWLRYAKAKYPELLPNISTAKSPQQMFGATAKTYFASVLGVSPEKIVCVSIMPCVAKKSEADLSSMKNDEYGKDVDFVLTTREFEKMVKAHSIDVASLEEAEFDAPIGYGSGAGVIFGTTGGVMEAALRTAHYAITGENPDADFIKQHRIDNGIGEFKATIGGLTLSIAVVSGLKNAETLIEKIKAGFVKYDFIEVMACPSGCAGGGGQPIHDNQELGVERGKKLYALDEASEVRFSHENPFIKKLYAEYLEKPNSHRAHEILHVDHNEK